MSSDILWLLVVGMVAATAFFIWADEQNAKREREYDEYDARWNRSGDDHY